MITPIFLLILSTTPIHASDSALVYCDPLCRLGYEEAVTNLCSGASALGFLLDGCVYEQNVAVNRSYEFNKEADCDNATRAFGVTMSVCLFTKGGCVCARELFPEFKLENPECISEGTSTCLNYCSKWCK